MDDSHSNEGTWKLLALLAAAALFLSVSFTVFLWQQESDLEARRATLAAEVANLEALKQNVGVLRSLIQDITLLSTQYPEARRILEKHHIPVALPPPTSAPRR